MKAAALIGLSLAVAGVSAANAATISEIDASSLPADAFNRDLSFAVARDNSTQIPIGTPIALLFIGAALIFNPTVFKVSGSTLFGGEGIVAGVDGLADFGVPGPLDFGLPPPDVRSSTINAPFELSASFDAPTWTDPDPAVSNTPLPATLPLFATGLGALGLLGWFRKRKALPLDVR